MSDLRKIMSVCLDFLNGKNFDLLVMDDGWFGKRDDDNSSLGDCYVNSIHAKGLEPNAMYTINGGDETYSGAALMYAGLPIEREVPEYTAFQFYLQKK